MDNLVFIGMGCLMGSIFGVVLEKSGVLDPDTIIGQLQLRRFTMLRVFLSAIITGLLVYFALYHLGYERLNWKIMSIGPDIIGGSLLGIGIAFAGGCPGTVFGQIGIGYKDAWVTLLGALMGAFVCIKTKSPLIEMLSTWPSEKLTLDGTINCSFSFTSILLILGFSGFLLMLKHLPK